MDSVIHTALEEICSKVQDGLTLALLWPRLQPILSSLSLDLCPGVKQAIWSNLRDIPTLRFEVREEFYSPVDPSIQSFENAEKLNLKIIAQQNLRDNFVGLYESNSFVDEQMRVLELLANARAHGITQAQLGKQLQIKANNFYYVLRSLECQGLIVKQSALERKKETCADGDSKNLPCVSTNLVYLRRYAKQLGSHQRIEITTEEQKLKNPEDANGSSIGETDVHVKDYAPQVKAICDKLAKENGKVLVVSDIKKDLGYCGSRSKQRAWREICRRLKADNIAEQFDAKVNGKVEACLRLLDPVTTGSENEDKNSNCGKKCQIMDQFVELPLEHQIFDMIDAAGADGIYLKEICERLGLDLKESHRRILNMCDRFGIKVQEEQCEKFKSIRLRTSRNCNPAPEVALIHKPDEDRALDQRVPDSSGIIVYQNGDPTSNGDPADPGKWEDRRTDAKFSCGSPEIESNCLDTQINLPGLVVVPSGTELVSTAEGDVASLKTLPPDVSTLFVTGPYQSSSFTVNSIRRAKRILEKLEEEKFILRPEIHRWHNSFEKVDRKTIDRILDKLQEQGLCKLITVSVPVVTKYLGQKQWLVVVHPSISLSSEVFDKIYNRARSFDIHIRSQCTSQKKDDESIPVMEDLQKTQSPIVPDERPGKAEALRANGFVLAKMVRAKLLHSFLWDYLNSSAGHNDASSSENWVNELNNPHRSSKLFSLEAAIKAIPLELFLQVVGSTNKYEEMIEKCKMGLRLCDLPADEYKSLMDTLATGRLSLIIDILRRLKLVRIVTDLQSRDGIMTPHASFTHMMELKPYIEEPLSNDQASLNFISIDLRPRIRHDFVLSNRDAIDEYWQTLEYCYAAADQKAASFAFPGSAVHEVFRFRSWASTRLMTSEQRAELLRHVVKDGSSGKISYKECEKIAKDLNLTLEQVLSVYYSKRRHGLNQFKDQAHDCVKNAKCSLKRKGRSSCCQEKDSPESRPAMHARIDAATDIAGIDMEEQDVCMDTGEHDTHMEGLQEDGHQEIENNEDFHPLINRCVLSKMKPTRRRRFLWSDETDRQLVMQYVKHRAALGAKYHRTDWASVSDLPAPPSTCRKRMTTLNHNIRFREAVMRLCNMLGERYAEHLEKSQSMSLNKDESRKFVRSPSKKGIHIISHNVETQATNLSEEAWDDFENKSIKTALDEVLRCKKMAKLETSSEKDRSLHQGWSAVNAQAEGYDSQENEVIPSVIPSELIQNRQGKNLAFSGQRSRSRRLDKKFTRFLNIRANVNRQVHESLAVSNAVELFKLVFLSTSTGPQASNLLADILRRYSEHDLFAAFNYLREKKIMIGGNGSEPFELSQKFLQSISKSPFPVNTGKRAVKFSTWLQERDKDLTKLGANLTEDLQCGDIFHLFALVSSGELSISPCVPDNGVGEAEDLRNAKRKLDVNESFNGGKAKKLKSSFGVEGEVISRREKGFPGIVISASRATISRADTLDLVNDYETCKSGQSFEGTFQLNKEQSCKYSLPELEIFNSCDIVPIEEEHSGSPWEAMAGYAQHLMLMTFNQNQRSVICAEVFRVVYAAIQEAGDQGLSMEEVSQVVNLPGAEVDGLIVDVLEAFGRALKVNAYDSVRVVDALFHGKYFLTSISGHHQVVQRQSSLKTIERSDAAYKHYKSRKCDVKHANFPTERNNDVHKVTILNFPCGDLDPDNQDCNRHKGMQDEAVSSRVDHGKETSEFSSGELHVPILPWINGDGMKNNIVYKGLTRRVLGIVMQNPGMLEDDIIGQMHVLNPQSCRTLLEMMILDKHLIVRKMQQNKPDGAPSLLHNLIRSESSQSKFVCSNHFFANPMSSSLL